MKNILSRFLFVALLLIPAGVGATIQWSNNATSFIAVGSDIGSGSTSVTVTTGEGDKFPAVASPHYFMITLVDVSGNREIVKCTARSAGSNTMTIARGQEGTTPRAFAAGSFVDQRITAGSLDEFSRVVDFFETYYICDYSAADQADTVNSLSLASITGDVGTTKRATIVLPHSSTGSTTPYNILQALDLSLNDNITYIIERGAVLTHGANTIAMSVPQAGNYQIFSGTGAITFNDVGLEPLRPEWWGAENDPNTDYAAEVQDALDAAKLTSGGTVLLSGMYGVGDSGWTGLSLDSIDDISITGLGWHTGLNLLSIPSQTIAASQIILLKFGGTAASGIKVSNFKIDLNGILANGIGFDTVSDSEISGLEITNSPVGTAGDTQRAITLAKGFRNNVLNNYIHHVGSCFSFGVVGATYFETLSTMRGNKFENCFQTSEAYLRGGAMEENTFLDGGYLADDTTASHGSSFASLEVGGRPGAGMEYWSVSENIIKNSRGIGLQFSPASSGTLLSKGRVSDNTVYSSVSHAIYTFGGIEDVLIEGNICMDNGRGITLTRDANGGASKIIIANNTCGDTRSGGSRTQARGIEVGSSNAIANDFNEIIIKGNILKNNSAYGLYLSGPNPNSTTDVIVVNNIIKSNSTYGIFAEEGVDGLVISNNTVLSNTTKDIRLKHATSFATPLLNNRYDTLQDAAARGHYVGNRMSAEEETYDIFPDVDFKGLLYITKKLAPAELTGDVNDYEPSGIDDAAILRLTSDASRTITGIAAPTDGRVLIIYNFGGQNIVLAESSASSVAANRILTGSGNFTITPGMSVTLIYESGGSKWRLLN